MIEDEQRDGRNEAPCETVAADEIANHSRGDAEVPGRRARRKEAGAGNAQVFLGGDDIGPGNQQLV